MLTPAASPRRGNLLFLLLLSLETAVLSGLAWSLRVPREHDGFGYFGMQYYFLNNAAAAGELPQWIPYMMQGTVASWWYAVQGGIFVNSVALIAGQLGILKGLNFLPFFYLGIWFDGLILLVGTWLLARRLFRSYFTTFFVCSIIAGPCIWMSQPRYNFHFYYAFPLILALVHRFLDRGSWLSLSLAINLFALQTIGNLPYYVPVSSLVIVLYFGLYTLFNRPEQFAAVRRLHFGFPAALTVLVGLVGLAAAFLILRLGAGEIANYSPGRAVDARVSLETFLTYGGEITKTEMGRIVPWGFAVSGQYALYGFARSAAVGCELLSRAAEALCPSLPTLRPSSPLWAWGLCHHPDLPTVAAHEVLQAHRSNGQCDALVPLLRGWMRV